MFQELKLFKKTTSILGLSIIILLASLVGAFFIHQAYSFQDPTTVPTSPGNQSSAAADQASLSQIETDLSSVNTDTDSIQADLNIIKNKAGSSGYSRTTDSLEALREKLDSLDGGGGSSGSGAGPLLEWKQIPGSGNGFVGIAQAGPAGSGSQFAYRFGEGKGNYWSGWQSDTGGSGGTRWWSHDFNAEIVANPGELLYISAKDASGAYSNILTYNPSNQCGNGIQEAGEICDDGNASWSSGNCAADCSGLNRFSLDGSLGYTNPNPAYDYMVIDETLKGEAEVYIACAALSQCQYPNLASDSEIPTQTLYTYVRSAWTTTCGVDPCSADDNRWQIYPNLCDWDPGTGYICDQAYCMYAPYPVYYDDMTEYEADGSPHYLYCKP